LIGTLGDIVFEVSRDKVRTFDNLTRKGAARWATHDVVGKKPVREFIGQGLESISFTMHLSVSLGVNPLAEINKLRELRDKGTPMELVLNGTSISDNLWVLEDLSEDWRKLDNKGILLFADVDVSLQEYPRDSDSMSTANNNSTAGSREAVT
jgi:phage protein U